MGFFSFCSVKFFVLVIVLDFAASTEPTRTPVRRGLQNVIRVGKRYGDDDLWDFPTEDKRFGKLMAFPRVGRSSTSWTADENTEKRSDSNSGIWFGPRIGRSSSKIEDGSPWTYILWNSDKPLNRHTHDINSRGDGEEDSSSENNGEESKEQLFNY
ncbi:uncharacterized protein LOC108905363 [Anoplophora glabripennis]|uniref:uncharacterized protein LOC108905363 n=1 Tax=Anoplophora glabripennis TaxID=217634 RepID=UPI000874F2D5|nr:uncharacterized protein LOC108905363 [Anoplophora glabripennis]